MHDNVSSRAPISSDHNILEQALDDEMLVEYEDLQGDSEDNYEVVISDKEAPKSSGLFMSASTFRRQKTDDAALELAAIENQYHSLLPSSFTVFFVGKFI